MNKGKRFWINSNRGVLRISMIICFIVVFLLAAGSACNAEDFKGLRFFVTIAVGSGIIVATHMLWGLFIEMADNIASIADGEVETSDNEIRIPRPISQRVETMDNGIKISRPVSERTGQTPAQQKDSIKPFVVNIEYDDGTWECGNCRQLNASDCEFCTNCGKAKGKLKIPPKNK